MSFYNFKLLTGVAVTLAACLTTAQPGVARPLNQHDALLLSQVNKPETEGTPQLSTNEVQGRITKIDGDEVELRLSTGETRTYTIAEADQERNRLAVGSDVVLTVRGDTVVAISPGTESTTQTSESAQSGQSSSSQSGQSSSSSSSSSSSTTVIRRESTVQQTRPAPAPAPAAQPAPQPVRGLW